MSTKKELTKVVFRKYQDGEIIALLPEIKADNLSHCMSFFTMYNDAQSEQYGIADYGYVVAHTKRAKPKEFKALKEKLENVGFDLNIRYKHTKKKMNRVEKY